MEGNIILKKENGMHKQSEKKKFIGKRDIYNTKRDIIECKRSCKAIPKIQKKKKSQGERNIQS